MDFEYKWRHEPIDTTKKPQRLRHCGLSITVLGNLLLGKLLVFCQLCSTEVDLRRVIGATGYEVQQVTSEEVQKKGLFGGLFGK